MHLLPRVNPPNGPQQHGRAERRQARTSKGSFLAPLRTHSRGHDGHPRLRYIAVAPPT